MDLLGIGGGIQNKGNVGPVVRVTPGNVRPGEPIADPEVRAEMRELWHRSKVGTPDAHEEGESFYGRRRRGAGTYSKPLHWQPGETLAQARAQKKRPSISEPALLVPSNIDLVVQTHTHAWQEGTFLFDTRQGPSVLAPGPSAEDVDNIRGEGQGSVSVMGYVIDPEGIYRITNGGGVQRIAPVGYLDQ